MPGENLTRLEAQTRRSTVDSKSYQVNLDLTHGEETFLAKTVINFDAKAGTSTFIDLIAKNVFAVTLNGQKLDPETVFKDSRVELTNLSAENTVEISSEQFFMNTGEGLHRFVDPADGEVYLYSQFEVPDARRMFAVFEQPDLKATFQFTVTAPAYWKVVSVQPTPAPENLRVKDGVEIATWVFDPTPKMSSYITALIAGPYHEVRSSLTNYDGREIPLGVFCRKSLAPHLDAEYIFDITRRGFDFFSKKFDYAFPFEKYDQLFVPEYNAGAMENIGAVTFTEAYIFRSKVPDASRERRVVTILHELAHMWFGDLVTMKWWDDLWLNESFAEYMSILATAEATEWSDAWTTFVASEKSWAYRQDQLPSTHPVYAEINDLDDVMVNFDGITYAKGASVLKQLVAWVGQDDFMRGVHNYFVKHAYSNTELKDLLVELEATSGKDLKGWTQQWLKTSGVNTLRAAFETDDSGSFTSFKVEQTAHPDYPVLRPHKINIGLYNLDSESKLVRTQSIETHISGAVTEIADLVGAARPDLVLLNDEDLTYAKIRFDDRSLETINTHFKNFEDSLPRSLVWGSLWDTTRDGEMSATKFIDFVLENIDIETNSTMMRTVLGQLNTALHLYSSPVNRAALLTKATQKMWELTQAAAPGSDAQFQLLKTFVGLVADQKHSETIKGLLSGESKLAGLELDQDLKWDLLVALAANGVAGETAISAALVEDTTASGQQAAARARAAIPTPEAKAATWKTMVQDKGQSNLMIRNAGLGFMRANDNALLEPYVDEFFAGLLTVWNERSFAISEEIIDGFYPMSLGSETLLQRTRDWLAQNEDAAPALRRYMIENVADLERALKAQEVDAL